MIFHISIGYAGPGADITAMVVHQWDNGEETHLVPVIMEDYPVPEDPTEEDRMAHALNIAGNTVLYAVHKLNATHPHRS